MKLLIDSGATARHDTFLSGTLADRLPQFADLCVERLDSLAQLEVILLKLLDLQHQIIILIGDQFGKLARLCRIALEQLQEREQPFEDNLDFCTHDADSMITVRRLQQEPQPRPI